MDRILGESRNPVKNQFGGNFHERPTRPLADVALAVSWAFFSGSSRQLSLATGAFFGAGAYVAALVGTRLMWPLPVLAGAAVGGAMALVVGALALRLRGPYFATFTFGVAELVKDTLIMVRDRRHGHGRAAHPGADPALIGSKLRSDRGTVRS